MRMIWEIDARRLKLSILMGVASGIICLYGTMTSIPGVLSLPILATIFYDRVLLGFVVGIAYGLGIHPLIRGAAIVAIVSLVIAIPSGIIGGSMLMGAGIVYGVIIDLVATRFSKAQDRVFIE